MNSDKKKALAIGAVVALIIILLLLFGRKGTTIINRAAPDGFSLPGLGDINLGDLIVPDLGHFLGASSCGCVGTKKMTVYQEMPLDKPVQYQPPPPAEIRYVRAAPTPSPMSSMSATFGPALKPWYFAGGSDGRI